MSTQKSDRGGHPPPTAPGKPGSRQPPDNNTGKPREDDRNEGQELPKTGRDPREAIEEDRAN